MISRIVTRYLLIIPILCSCSDLIIDDSGSNTSVYKSGSGQPIGCGTYSGELVDDFACSGDFVIKGRITQVDHNNQGFIYQVKIIKQWTGDPLPQFITIESNSVLNCKKLKRRSVHIIVGAHINGRLEIVKSRKGLKKKSRVRLNQNLITCNDDIDGDGLSNDEERQFGTNPLNSDTDGDGLLDGWEVYGHQGLDLMSMGADPTRKDIFVECDYMDGQAPRQEAIDIVVQSFDNSNVPNGQCRNCKKNGINLHVYIDEEIPTDTNLDPVWDEFYQLKSMSPERERIFHYCIWGVRHNGGRSSGISDGIGSNNFLVTLGRNATVEQQAGTFMHQLGHNLGLRHGGKVDTDHKPNYVSVMNSTFQMIGVYRNESFGHFDYTKQPGGWLDENRLNEYQGMKEIPGKYGTLFCVDTCDYFAQANGSIDWNQDGLLSNSVRADINGDGRYEKLGASSDWNRLDYHSGLSIGVGGVTSRSPWPHNSECEWFR